MMRKTPVEAEPAMRPAVGCRATGLKVAASSVDRKIRDFLGGESAGEELLHALYDHVLDEAVPQRLRSLLRV